MLTDIGADDFLHHTSQVVILSLQILSNSIMISLIWGAKYIWSAIAASTLTGSSLSVRKMLMVCLNLPVDWAILYLTSEQQSTQQALLIFLDWRKVRFDRLDCLLQIIDPLHILLEVVKRTTNSFTLGYFLYFSSWILSNNRQPNVFDMSDESIEKVDEICLDLGPREGWGRQVQNED